jgi:hypothetical protein
MGMLEYYEGEEVSVAWSGLGMKGWLAARAMNSEQSANRVP